MKGWYITFKKKSTILWLRAFETLSLIISAKTKLYQNFLIIKLVLKRYTTYLSVKKNWSTFLKFRIMIGFAIVYLKKVKLKECVINQFFNYTIKQDKVHLDIKVLLFIII